MQTFKRVYRFDGNGYLADSHHVFVYDKGYSHGGGENDCTVIGIRRVLRGNGTKDEVQFDVTSFKYTAKRRIQNDASFTVPADSLADFVSAITEYFHR